jgi:hypothetical protein
VAGMLTYSTRVSDPMLSPITGVKDAGVTGACDTHTHTHTHTHTRTVSTMRNLTRQSETATR